MDLPGKLYGKRDVDVPISRFALKLPRRWWLPAGAVVVFIAKRILLMLSTGALSNSSSCRLFSDSPLIEKLPLLGDTSSAIFDSSISGKSRGSVLW